MWKYVLWYDGGFLRDSADLGYTYETEEEAKEEAEADIEDRIDYWKSENSEYEEDLFDIEIEEV